jgi:hypothetical protein
MNMLQSLFYLTIALHVSGIIITHLQEHKTTVTTASGNCYTVLLPVAIVEELEKHASFQLLHDSNRQQYGVTVTRCCSYSCFVLLKMGDDDTRNARGKTVASLWGNVCTGKKEDESITGHIWVAGFHHVMARSRLACVLILTNHLVKFNSILTNHLVKFNSILFSWDFLN